MHSFKVNFIYAELFKRSPGRGKCIWEDNIKIDLKEIGREGMGRIYLVQYWNEWWALVNVVMNFGFHKRRGVS
jgi:hypothetical protein